MRRRRARSLGDESSADSLHRHEVRVQELEVHPAYNLGSPERDSFQDVPEEQRAEGQDPPAREDLVGIADAATAAWVTVNPAEGDTGPVVERTQRVQIEAERRLEAAERSPAAPLATVGDLMGSLPPGFDGEVPMGPVEAQVAAAAAPGDRSGESYIARSLDAMGNVLSSLLGRMTSLEQQRGSNRSSTPTSDGLENQLHQLSLAADPRFPGGRPFLVDRPLATAERIMAGTFSSDDSDTARRRAEEARRVIPGAIMRPPGPPEQHVMGEAGAFGASSVIAPNPSMAGPGVESGSWDLPPVPPSTLGYFVPPERLSGAAAPWRSPSVMGPCSGMSSRAPLARAPCSTMPPHANSSVVASSSMSPCLPIPRVCDPQGEVCLEGQGHAGMGRPASVTVPASELLLENQGAFVEGVPTMEGQRGFIQVEGQRLSCVCFGGKLVIEMDSVGEIPNMRGDLYERPHPPPPPPGPPPPTPPQTPRVKPRTVTYGSSSSTSMTPGGTPIPPATPTSPEIIEEPSKLVNKLPALASLKGTTHWRRRLRNGWRLAGTTGSVDGNFVFRRGRLVGFIVEEYHGLLHSLA